MGRQKLLLNEGWGLKVYSFSSAFPLVLIARCKSEMAVLHDSVTGNRGVNE